MLSDRDKDILRKAVRKINNIRGPNVKNTPEGIFIGDGDDSTQGDSKHRNLIVAKLTSQDGSDQTKFAWMQYRRTASGYESPIGALSGTTSSHPAYYLDTTSTTDFSGSYCLLSLQPFTNSSSNPDMAWIIVELFGSTSTPDGGETSPTVTLSGSGTTADSTSWYLGDTDEYDNPLACTATIATRDYYDTTGHVLYYFTREFLWDSNGILNYVSGETQNTTDTAGPCSAD